MAIAFVASSTGASSDGTNLSAAASMNTTGANFLIVALGDYQASMSSPSTVTDSKGNTWIPLSVQGSTDGQPRVRLHYAVNPSVGSSHTFSTVNAVTPVYPAIAVAAFSGVTTSSPYNSTAGESGGSNGGGATVQPGAITPSVDNCLIVVAQAFNGTAESDTINGGFASPIEAGPVVAGSVYAGLSYLIQTSAASANPTWTGSGAIVRQARIASFFVSAGGPALAFWQIDDDEDF